MNLVLYTKNPELKNFFNQALPPTLSQEVFQEEQELKEFLKKLTIPTQVILDKDSYKLSLKAFFQQYKFHHIVCVSHSLGFYEALELLHYGSLLMSWNDLMCKDWWWNRSLMSFKRQKIHECPQQAIILVPHTHVLKVRHFLESSIWRLFYQEKPRLVTIDISEPHLKSKELLTIFFNTLKSTQSPEKVAVFLNNFGNTSPKDLKEFLEVYKTYENDFNELRLFIYFDAQHANFERAFDHCSAYLTSKIYRLDCKKAERMSQKFISTAQTEELYSSMSQSLVLEEAKLSWKSSLA